MPIDRLKLQNSIIEEQIKAARDEQKRLRLQARAARDAHVAGQDELETAAAAELWQKVDEKANELINDGQRGYDNWNSSMSQIYVLLKKSVAAMSASDPLGSVAHFVYEWGVIGGGRLLADHLGYSIRDWYNGVPDSKLPEVHVALELDDEDKLDLNHAALEKIISRSDGQPVTRLQTEEFAAGITAWLAMNGYVPAPNYNGSFIHRDDETPLVKDTFNELRDDQRDGLGVWLSGQYVMEIKHTPSMRP